MPLLGGAVRTAEDRRSIADTHRVLAANRNLLGIENQVVRHEEIEPAVAIVVDPGATRSVACAFVQEPRLFGDFPERAVAFVMEQDVLPPTGDKDVVESVVIVVA